MLVNEFVKAFAEKKIVNTKINEHAVSDYLRKELNIQTYLPFKTKRQIVEAVVAQNTKWVDGVKKNDSIGQYVSFVIAMLVAHTNLECSANPIDDYDLLAESGLLPQIIAEFKASYDECDILLKMALASELEDNNIEVLVGHFLDTILKKIDNFGDALKDKFGDFNPQDVFGADFNEEDLAKLSGFLDKLK